MTREGAKLEGVDSEQLHQQLRRETDAKATKQLTVALLYDAGISAYEIEDLLGVPAQTGCNWLQIVAERCYVALGDAPKAGRPMDRTDGGATRSVDRRWLRRSSTVA